MAGTMDKRSEDWGMHERYGNQFCERLGEQRPGGCARGIAINFVKVYLGASVHPQAHSSCGPGRGGGKTCAVLQGHGGGREGIDGDECAEACINPTHVSACNAMSVKIVGGYRRRKGRCILFLGYNEWSFSLGFSTGEETFCSYTQSRSDRTSSGGRHGEMAMCCKDHGVAWPSMPCKSQRSKRQDAVSQDSKAATHRGAGTQRTSTW